MENSLLSAAKSILATIEDSEKLCDSASDKRLDVQKFGVTWAEYRSMTQEFAGHLIAAIAFARTQDRCEVCRVTRERHLELDGGHSGVFTDI